jgi:transposase
MVLVRQRTQLKNRIHSTLAKYALRSDEVSDLFGARGRALLRRHLEALPPHTAFATRALLEQVEHLDGQVRALEDRMRSVFWPTPTIEWLRTLPGVGFNLAVVIALELGDIRRFPAAERFASYAGTTPRVRASGGQTPYGALRPDVNRYQRAAPPTPRAPCQPALRAPRAQGPSQGHRGGGAPSRGGHVLDPDQGGGVSGADEVDRFVHTGVSAACP